MRAAQSRPVVNSVTLSSFAEGRMRLFGAEIFNNFSVAIAVSEPGWKQRIHATYKSRQVVIQSIAVPFANPVTRVLRKFAYSA